MSISGSVLMGLADGLAKWLAKRSLGDLSQECAGELIEFGREKIPDVMERQYVVRQFERYADAYRAGSLLRDLHTERIKADYRLDNRRIGTSAFAKLCVETASEIQAALKSCRAEPARSEIKARL